MFISICSPNSIDTRQLINNIQKYLKFKKNYSVINSFSSFQKLLLHCSYYGEPDIIFSCIDSDEADTIQNLVLLRKVCPDTEIVIMSTCSSNASVGYRIRAAWYLQIPFEAREIKEALDYCIHEFVLKNRKRFHVRSDGKALSIPYDDIKFFESIKHYIYIHTMQQQYRFRENIGTLSIFLPNSYFFRCHKCYIVNLIHVQELTTSTIVLASNEEVPLSRNYRESIFRAYSIYSHLGNKE